MGFDKKDKTLMNYTCPYPTCNHSWKQYVGTSAGKKPVSSQVVCPICGNGVKTW